MSDQQSLRSKGDVLKEILDKCDTYEEKISLLMNELLITQNNNRTEKKLNEDLRERLRETEIETRNQEEDVQSLKYNNDRLTKRINTLSNQLNQSKSAKGIFSSLWGGDSTQKDKLKDEMEIIKEHLGKVINENETLNHKIQSAESEKDKIETEAMSEKKSLISTQTRLTRELTEVNEINNMVTNDLNTQKHNHEVVVAEKKEQSEGYSSTKTNQESFLKKKQVFISFLDKKLKIGDLASDNSLKGKNYSQEDVENEVINLTEQLLGLVSQLICDSKAKAAFQSSIAQKNSVEDLIALIPTYTMTLDQLNGEFTGQQPCLTNFLKKLKDIRHRPDDQYQESLKPDFQEAKQKILDTLSVLFQVPSILKGLYDGENFTTEMKESFSSACSQIIKMLEAIFRDGDQFIEDITTDFILENWLEKQKFENYLKKVQDFFTEYLRAFQGLMDKLISKNTTELQKVQKMLGDGSQNIDNNDYQQLEIINKKISSLFKKCLISFFNQNNYLIKFQKNLFTNIAINKEWNFQLEEDQAIINKMKVFKEDTNERITNLKKENQDLMNILQDKESYINQNTEKITELENELVTLAEQQKKFGMGEDNDDLNAITEDLKLLDDNEDKINELNEVIRKMNTVVVQKVIFQSIEI